MKRLLLFSKPNISYIQYRYFLNYSGGERNISNQFTRKQYFKNVIKPGNILAKDVLKNISLRNKSSDSDSHKGSRSKKNSPSKSTIDSLGAWDDNYELPLLMDASIEKGIPVPHTVAGHVGYSTIIGKRNYQEDRYFVKDFGSDLLCCAVFDGHGGEECSNFCADSIEVILESKLKKSELDLEAALHDTILELNSSYAKCVEHDDKGKRSGSTCTICLLKKGLELFIGHVGDSRVLLSRNGAPRRLTVDHCPSNLAEKNRIKQSGGKVITDNIGRHMVNGILNMSRSIGDFHLKPYGVSALPDIRKYQIKHAKDSFILLTTDGVNYVLNDEEICNVINHAQDPEFAATSLTEQAVSMSSEDNITALVIPLGSWGKFAKSAASMFYSFGIGRDMSKSSRFG